MVALAGSCPVRIAPGVIQLIAVYEHLSHVTDHVGGARAMRRRGERVRTRDICTHERWYPIQFFSVKL